MAFLSLKTAIFLLLSIKFGLVGSAFIFKVFLVIFQPIWTPKTIYQVLNSHFQKVHFSILLRVFLMLVFDLLNNFSGQKILDFTRYTSLMFPDQTKPNLMLKVRKTAVLSDKKCHKTLFSPCFEVFTPLPSISKAIGSKYNGRYQKGIF